MKTVTLRVPIGNLNIEDKEELIQLCLDNVLRTGYKAELFPSNNAFIVIQAEEFNESDAEIFYLFGMEAILRKNEIIKRRELKDLAKAINEF